MKIQYLFILLIYLFACETAPKEKTSLQAQVLVLGEGTGAIAAAIQSARSGAQTLLVTPSTWLGGMLTAAGVSAIDGNHELPAGLWGEFRDSLRDHYGGAQALATGWVSNTQFEPSVGEMYWKQMAAREDNLTVLYKTSWRAIEAVEDEAVHWNVRVENQTDTLDIAANILIDGTDLGDVAAQVGAAFDVGMDARVNTEEDIAPEQANDIIQDLTYAVVLQDFGADADKTIPKPVGYDASQFYCSCKAKCEDAKHPCESMLAYGKLPNDKYMINWPLKGNDYYVNMIEMNAEERVTAYEQAKNKSLQFVYYIQTELGYKNLGIAADEYPSEDGLPLMPYHREGRRMRGLVQLNLNHLLRPYDFTLYRTGIAVGDYPIDHHHFERPDAPEMDFPPVPSFSIPLGALIPVGKDYLIVADKAISVSNIVNGSSRLQPVVLQIGQAAGLLAAQAAIQNISPKSINIRDLQQALLEAKGYLMPFMDVQPTHPHFEAVQRIGATGVLQGKGIPNQWSNQTWFYPDTTVTYVDLLANTRQFNPSLQFESAKGEELLRIEDALTFVYEWRKQLPNSAYKNVAEIEQITRDVWEYDWKFEDFDLERPITKIEFAALLDAFVSPFGEKVDFMGET
ncbi:MAG: FAD-dependent oxidoreductase [Bacteroidota bacterium]